MEPPSTKQPMQTTNNDPANAHPVAQNPSPRNINVPTPARRIAVSRAEAILLLILVLLGMGVWGLADWFVTSKAKGYEPREEEFQLARSLPRLQAGLSMTLDERKSTQEQLIKTRLELAAHESALAALEAFPSTAPTAAEARAETLRKREAAARLVNSLIARLTTLQAAADDLGASIEHARRGVAGDFYSEHWNFRVMKAVITLALSGLVLTMLVWGVSALRRAKAMRGKVPGLSADGSLMWWTMVGLILVLIGYQAFETAGAAVAGVFVLLVFLARVPWAAVEAKAQAGAGSNL